VFARIWNWLRLQAMRVALALSADRRFLDVVMRADEEERRARWKRGVLRHKKGKR
jgi:hypothetical protein